MCCSYCAFLILCVPRVVPSSYCVSLCCVFQARDVPSCCVILRCYSTLLPCGATITAVYNVFPHGCALTTTTTLSISLVSREWTHCLASFNWLQLLQPYYTTTAIAGLSLDYRWSRYRCRLRLLQFAQPWRLIYWERVSPPSCISMYFYAYLGDSVLVV